jgi:hypothetical protein
LTTKLRFFVGLMIALFASFSFESPALAQRERPVIVEYIAPTPECASSEAFQLLLAAEIARSPNPDRTWRFSVLVRRQGEFYEGTLTTETGVRKVTATRCDDVTAALALIVAMAEPEPDAPAPTPPADEPALAPQPAAPPAPARTRPVVSSLPTDRTPAREDGASRLEWRFGIRGMASSHGMDSPTLGGLAFGSVELPWGFRKMMFEVGVGTFSDTFAGVGPVSSPSPGITYYMVDTQSCLLDLPIENTGLSVLGCIRVAGASFKTSLNGTKEGNGGALWFGAGVRLRWQSRFSLFFEVNADGVYGTVSSGEDNNPGWFDAGASVGFML